MGEEWTLFKNYKEEAKSELSLVPALVGNTLKISPLFLCPAGRIERIMTKAPPTEAHTSNSHARGSPQLSDVLALAVNTEILVLPQARVSLLPQAFAFSSFIAVPFFLGSNKALRL